MYLAVRIGFGQPGVARPEPFECRKRSGQLHDRGGVPRDLGIDRQSAFDAFKRFGVEADRRYWHLERSQDVGQLYRQKRLRVQSTDQ